MKRQQNTRQMSSGEPFYFIHSLPRRTRLKVPGRRRDKAFFAEIERLLGALTGVHSVTATPETGSIIVHHAPEFRWSSVRFEAMGMRPADRASKCSCTCPNCSGNGSSELDLATAAVWMVKAACSGQILLHLIELAITKAVQWAIDDLTKPVVRA